MVGDVYIESEWLIRCHFGSSVAVADWSDRVARHKSIRMVAELCVRPSTAGKLGEALGWNREGRLRQGSRAGNMTIAGCSGTVGSE